MQLSGATGDAAQRDGVVDELELRHERADPGPQAIVVLGVGALDLRTAAAEVGEDGADVLGDDDVDDRPAGEQPGGELGAGAFSTLGMYPFGTAPPTTRSVKTIERPRDR